MYFRPLQDFIVTLSVIAAAVGKWQVANFTDKLIFWLKLRVGGFFAKFILVQVR